VVLTLDVILFIPHFLSLTFSIAEKVTKKLEKNMPLPTGLMRGPHFFGHTARLLFKLLS
jgi:hypothetical protein